MVLEGVSQRVFLVLVSLGMVVVGVDHKKVADLALGDLVPDDSVGVAFRFLCFLPPRFVFLLERLSWPIPDGPATGDGDLALVVVVVVAVIDLVTMGLLGLGDDFGAKLVKY